MKIIIIGAGTAGYSAAAALSMHTKLNISLIEPTQLPTIGVGESTIPMMHIFHKKFKLFSDLKWLEKSNGSMKFTIMFRNFMKDSRTWIHPFDEFEHLNKIHLLDNTHLNNYQLTSEICYNQQLNNKGFHPNNEELSHLGAYHFDAGLYVQELKKVALSRNVKIYNNQVIQINQNKNITESIMLDDQTTLTADLYIDCTGFKNILFEKLDSKFTPFTDRLFCDKALAVKLPYVDEKEQKINATLCHALGNGWVWHTPLEDCIAVGYVFSSTHTSQDSATLEFKDYLHSKYGYDTKDIEFKLVHYRSGMLKDGWIGNNIAIGLSSFFIEPIESTGIGLFQAQILQLYTILNANMESAMNYKNTYNKNTRQAILAVKKFVEMHYTLSDRRDTQFWKDATDIKLDKEQEEIMYLYEKGDFESLIDLKFDGMFSSYNFLIMLLGMDKRKK